MGAPHLLDDRSLPDLRDHYLRHLRQAREVAVALSRVRLAGLHVETAVLRAPSRIRVLVMEVSGLTLAMEAERLAEDRLGRERIATLAELARSRRLEIRSAPLGGWAPDFSVFSGPDGAEALIVGLHWMDRPYPHRGPALASLHGKEAAARILARFEELWREAHDVGDAIARTLATALDRCGAPAGVGEAGHAPSPGAEAPRLRG
jgi:hypothetical protein